MRTNERWSEEEWGNAQHLLTLHDRTTVARMITRSRGCLVEKIRWEGMTEDQKQTKRDKIKARRAGIKSGIIKRVIRGPRTPNPIVVSGTRISVQAIEDRNTRSALAPRDLTAAFFGDPLPGYSALERRV